MGELAIKIGILQKIIRSKIEFLNDGGCIHFAYFFSKRLTELEIPHKIFATSHWVKLSYNVKNFLPPTHIMIYIDGIGYIDGYETVLREDFKSIKLKYHIHGKLSIKKLNIFRHINGWNKMYHKTQNPLLSKLINRYV